MHKIYSTFYFEFFPRFFYIRFDSLVILWKCMLSQNTQKPRNIHLSLKQAKSQNRFNVTTWNKLFFNIYINPIYKGHVSIVVKSMIVFQCALKNIDETISLHITNNVTVQTNVLYYFIYYFYNYIVSHCPTSRLFFKARFTIVLLIWVLLKNIYKI